MKNYIFDYEVFSDIEKLRGFINEKDFVKKIVSITEKDGCYKLFYLW